MFKNRSIRLKLTLWFTIVLLVVVAITFFSLRFAGSIVLKGTIRDYLIGTVAENSERIAFVTEKSDDVDNIYIEFADGFLEIDKDYMDIVNDVYTSLYSADGTMLYGENPLSKETEKMPFTESKLWRITVKDVRYDLYDHKLTLELPKGHALWIRGVVPETESVTQLQEITKTSLLLLPILIALATIPAYLLADKLLSPIREIETAATHINKGDDLKERIAVKSNDEVGRLAKVINAMLDRLERSFETEKRFTSDASHELRTPTAVILAQCEYTLEKERSKEEYVEALDVITRQGQRMKTLIGDMLDYTRLDRTPERFTMTTLDLSDLTAETVNQMQLLKEKNITLAADIAADIEIEGNRDLLTRLLQNLITNAYRYGNENGHINVTLTESDDDIVLTVADDGIGIAEDEREKIFHRFYRADNSRSKVGTGLGLSIVKKIAELHNGAVELDSALGVGSTFRIFFKKN